MIQVGFGATKLERVLDQVIVDDNGSENETSDDQEDTDESDDDDFSDSDN